MKTVRLRGGVAPVVMVLIASILWAGNPGISKGGEVYLETTQGQIKKIPIGVLSDGSVSAQGVAEEVLRKDLERALYFDLLPPVKTASLAGDLKNGGLQGNQIMQAGSLKMDALVVMGIQRSENGLTLDGKVYETEKGAMIFGRRYVGSEALLRRMVHRFADEVTFRLTGEKGIAQTHIAYVSDVTGKKEIYIMDADGYLPKIITGNKTLNLSPAWSPDGNRIAYTSYRDGPPDIHVVALSTSRRWKVTHGAGLNMSPAWSPGGEGMAFASSRDGNTNIYWVDGEGKAMRRLTYGTGENVSPFWSPTGKEIAFTSDRGGTPQIYLMQTDGSNSRRLTFEGDYNSDPRWSPRGDRIAFSCRRGDVFRICTITPDGKDLRQVTQGPGSDESPTWAPDGRHIAFSSNREGRWHVYLMDLEGGNLERLSRDGGNHTAPAWSPN